MASFKFRQDTPTVHCRTGNEGKRIVTNHVILGVALLVAMSQTVAAKPADANTPSARLAALAEDYYDATARLDPLDSTQNGGHRYDDQLAITIAPAEVKKALCALPHG